MKSVTTAGQVVTESVHKPNVVDKINAPAKKIDNVRKCVACNKKTLKARQCSKCHAGVYCSTKCFKSHYHIHKVVCDSIEVLQERERSNVKIRFDTPTTPKQKRKLAKLVGSKCNIRCLFDDIEVNVLWDTGSMVSIVNNNWLNENMPSKEVKQISELVGDELQLKTANNTDMPVEGYVEVNVTIGESSVIVPMVVTVEQLDQPIIGYNVIEQIITSTGHIDSKLACSIPCKKFSQLVNFVKNKASNEDYLEVVKLKRHGVSVPKRSRINIKINCKERYHNQPVLFEPELEPVWHPDLVVGETVVKMGFGKSVYIPVVNDSDHDIWISPGTTLGVLKTVSSVIPLQPKVVKDKSEVSCSKVKCSTVQEDNSWLPQVDLTFPDENQKIIIRL